jgi:glyoxylate reductase
MEESMEILVTRRLPGRALERLAQSCALDIWDKDCPIPKEKLLARIKGKEGLLCLLTDPVDATVIDAAGSMRIIANYAVGYDNIDIRVARERGIVITNTPGVLTDATADLAWALLFSVARRIVEADVYLREGRWPGWDPNLMLGCDIFGKTLGIIGAGRIGKAVGLRSRGFNMRVVYVDERRNEVLESHVGAQRVELDDLLLAPDFISLHVPLTTGTRHLIGERKIALMKPTAVIINTSRGPVIDEEALAEALRSGRIAGAGLDVFESEPQVHPGLMKLKNVVILPHIASATVGTRAKMADMAVDNILAFLRGETPPNRVV